MAKKTRIRADAPNGNLHGYLVRDSSNVKYVGWDRCGNMLVWFKTGVYRYDGISRQRAVAAARAKSVGKYVHHQIKPLATRVTKLT